MYGAKSIDDVPALIPNRFRECREAIAFRSARLAGEYTDEALSGFTERLLSGSVGRGQR
jgi:hypothetical protein